MIDFGVNHSVIRTRRTRRTGEGGNIQIYTFNSFKKPNDLRAEKKNL